MEIDKNNYDKNGNCPYCGDDRFNSHVESLDNNKWLNKCIGCGEHSIHYNDKQYKIK